MLAICKLFAEFSGTGTDWSNNLGAELTYSYAPMSIFPNFTRSFPAISIVSFEIPVGVPAFIQGELILKVNLFPSDSVNNES